MIPGLILIVIIFFLWIPIWLLAWCIRRARGHNNPDEELLQSGHMPHKGFQPPRGASYRPPLASVQYVRGPLRTGKHHFHNADEKRAYERRHGVSSRAQRQWRRQEHKHAAAAAAAAQRAEEDKGKGRAASVSRGSVAPSSRVTQPKSAVIRESQQSRA
ncbi:unnamed protein product [Discula destructiva]